MKTAPCQACRRGLLAVAIMSLAMFVAVAAGSGAAARDSLRQTSMSQSPSMAASFIATPVEPWIFSLPVM
jgi:hypothetical protein